MGPRLYSVVSVHPKSGMQVLNYKTNASSLVTSAASETCIKATEEVGKHMRFEVSLRAHFSVFPTTRRGIIQKANNLALFCRKRPEDHEENVGDECTHNKDNEESVLERSITRGDESDDAFESSNGISNENGHSQIRV